MPTWNDRFPLIASSSQRAALKKRYRACLDKVAPAFDLDVAVLDAAKELGCGYFGCTYLLPEGRPHRVLKVTADNLEAATVALLTGWGEKKPEGIVKLGRIRRLGRCSVTSPRQERFCFRMPKWTAWGYRSVRVCPENEDGSTYRPIWVYEREELPGAWDVLRTMGMRRRTLDYFLSLILTRHRWYGIGKRQGSEPLLHERDDADQLLPARTGVSVYDAVPPYLRSLMDALEWLADRDILFYDFTKVVNLGWRYGTGVVIRDIGFASTEQQPEPSEVLAGLKGLRRRMWE